MAISEEECIPNAVVHIHYPNKTLSEKVRIVCPPRNVGTTEKVIGTIVEHPNGHIEKVPLKDLISEKDATLMEVTFQSVIDNLNNKIKSAYDLLNNGFSFAQDHNVVLTDKRAIHSLKENLNLLYSMMEKCGHSDE